MKPGMQPRLGGATLRLLALVGAVFLIIVLTPLTRWIGHAMAGSFDEPRGDVLIVLAGAGPENGVLGYSSYLRAQYAVWAYQQGRARRIYIAGGGSPPAAPGMRDFMRASGIPQDAITIETHSISTRENALEARNLLAAMPGTRVLLTSDFHRYRACRAFARAGIAVEPYAIPDAVKRSSSWSGRPGAFLLEIEELGKLGYYRVRGWI